MHLMAHVLGGEVAPEGKREYGPATVDIAESGGLFEGLSDNERAWMSHGDTVKRLPPGFHGIARTERLPLAAMSDGRNRFGVQFHPEVMHTPRGAEVLRNFLYRVCGCVGDWTPAAFIEEAVAELRRTIGDRHAMCALSGGVDSAVARSAIGSPACSSTPGCCARTRRWRSSRPSVRGCASCTSTHPSDSCVASTA
jgi:GMP synthase (glutamine-hydrolysing)